MSSLRVGILAVAILAAGPVASATAQPTRPAATQPQAPASPALDALDAEVQQLYQEAQAHIVRVQVPIRIPIDHPFYKWQSRFDPKLREQLAPSTQPGEGRPKLFVQTPTSRPLQFAPDENLIPLPPATATINVEFTGLVLNRQGDVLLPIYVDPDYLKWPLMVTVDGDQQATTARVTAADRQTSLSIVRLAEPAGKVARFSKLRPPHGSMVLMISPTRRQARIGIWTGGQDDNAILVNRQGEFAGIVRNGHTLYPTTFAPIVRQLLETGTVQRATLGVRISAVAIDDVRRLQLRALGARSAAHVDEVFPATPAARAGLQQGDLILSLAGEAVEDIATFAAAIAGRRGPTELVILRDGQERRVVVDLQVP